MISCWMAVDLDTPRSGTLDPDIERGCLLWPLAYLVKAILKLL
jgi:hypothetical protein